MQLYDTVLRVTGYLEDRSAGLVVDELQRQAADTTLLSEDIDIEELECLHTPPPSLFSTASERYIVHRPLGFC